MLYKTANPENQSLCLGPQAIMPTMYILILSLIMTNGEVNQERGH